VQFVVYWFQNMVAELLRFEEELKYLYKKVCVWEGVCVCVRYDKWAKTIKGGP